MSLPFPHIHTETCRPIQRDGHRVPLFAKLGMTEEDVVRADRKVDVTDWSLTKAITVDPHLGPRRRIERDGPLRNVDLHRRHPSDGSGARR